MVVRMTRIDNRTVVNNLGRAIVNKISLKLEGKEVLCLVDADIHLCYKDLWLTDKERKNASYYGIQSENTAKIRVGASDAVAATQPDASIAAAFGNRFVIPLDFEILTDHGPFYQTGLTDRLSFELIFNDYARVIRPTDTNVIYQINNIALEFDIVSCYPSRLGTADAPAVYEPDSGASVSYTHLTLPTIYSV